MMLEVPRVVVLTARRSRVFHACIAVDWTWCCCLPWRGQMARFASPWAAYAAIFGDWMMTCPTRRTARWATAANMTAFPYFFTHVPRKPLTVWGGEGGGAEGTPRHPLSALVLYLVS